MLGSNHTISTKRRSSDADAKESYPSTYIVESVDAYIEKTDAGQIGAFGVDSALEVFTLIVDDVIDLRVGDLVIDENSVRYIVTGVNDFDGNLDVRNHTEAIIKREHVGD